jgi:hypothetical protein
MYKTQNKAPWNGKSRFHFLSQEAPSSNTEYKIRKGQEHHSKPQANFNFIKNEIYARG